MTEDLKQEYKKLALRVTKRSKSGIKAGFLMERALRKYLTNTNAKLDKQDWRKANINKIYERDGGRCLWCHYKVTKKRATIDHLIPLCRGGHPTDLSNVTISCADCNQKKGSLTDSEYLLVLFSK